VPRFKNSQEIEARYGKIEKGKWADEARWMTIFKLPSYVTGVINSASGVAATRIYINKDCVEPLTKALEALRDKNLLAEFKTFDGCFMIRDIRGAPGKPSMHSYAIAIDINAKENGLGQPPKLSPEFVKCFTDAGWTWGGNFTRKDGMHFEFT
jgi:D-alanyl-D-alanine carboxypeptidase